MMTSTAARATLVLVAIAGIGVAGYWLVLAEGRIAAARAEGRAIDARARAALAGVAQLRAGHPGYVAEGQGEDFWMDRVSTLAQSLEAGLAALRRQASTEDGRAAIERASLAARNFSELDRRARDYVRAGQRLAASDLIFADGLETTAAAAAGIESAIGHEVQARDGAIARLRRREALALAGAAALSVIVLLALIPGGGRRAPAPAAIAPAATSAVELREAAPDLAQAAALCNDLARVCETRELPPLLQRAAVLLDASGIIVWIATESGESVRPAIAHGYSEQALVRMGLIARDADNAVAAAYRTGELRTVAGSSTAGGAIVAPLIGPSGCVGAVTTELGPGAEAREGVRALASIIAAQLATLVAAPQAASPAAQAQNL